MRISVLIPVYNAAEYLTRCLDSILAQTYSDWEVIAVDDGSKDNSFQILQEYAAKDNRITAVTKDNEGPGLTRNYALELAQGDYIVFVDSDDYIEPMYFEELEKCVCEKGSDVIFIDVIQERPDGSVICEEKMSAFAEYAKKDLISYQMCGTMPWGGVRKAAKRSLIEEHNIRYTKDPVGEEAAYSFKLLFYAETISFIPIMLYHYINYPVSQSKAGGEDPWGPVVEKIKKQLIDCGAIDEYKSTLNAFAFSALIVWVLRYATKHTVMDTYRAFIERRKVFTAEFSWDIAGQYLRKEARMLLPAVKNNILLPVVMASKLRNSVRVKA